MKTATANRLTAGLLFALGLASLYGGYVMDRLEIRQIHPASIPGLLPMILGGAMMLCAVLLFLSARKASSGDDSGSGSTRDLFAAGGLSIVYALVLVGRVPFEVATTLYIASFIAWFSWPVGGTTQAKIKLAALALVGGVIVAGLVAALFRYGFLVRLP